MEPMEHEIFHASLQKSLNEQLVKHGNLVVYLEMDGDQKEWKFEVLKERKGMMGHFIPDLSDIPDIVEPLEDLGEVLAVF